MPAKKNHIKLSCSERNVLEGIRDHGSHNWELYNVKTDRAELQNFVDKNPGKAGVLLAKWGKMGAARQGPTVALSNERSGFMPVSTTKRGFAQLTRRRHQIKWVTV